MFGFFKKRQADNISKRIFEHGARIQFFIRRQVDMSVENLHCTLEDIWRLETTKLYLLGACDALTCEFQIEMRQKVGLTIIEVGFLKLAKNIFGIEEAEARIALEYALVIQRKNPKHATIVEGGFDGIEMIKLKPAAGLGIRLYDIFVDGAKD